MPKPKKDPIQHALTELLNDPGVRRQVASHRTTPGAPNDSRVLSKAVEKGDIEFLCGYLRQHPALEIPHPIVDLMGQLRFLRGEIECEVAHPVFDPTPTHETLIVDEKWWNPLPVGTSDAAHQALIELVQAWVEGYLPNHVVQPRPPKTPGKRPGQRGPKDKVDSWNVYGEGGVREYLFKEMKTYVDASWPKAQLKKGPTEDHQHYEARAMEIVQGLHAEWGGHTKYWKSSPTANPPITPLPKETARTIVQQSMSTGKRTINARTLICSLLALYERDDPTQGGAIRQLITRNV